MTYVTNPDRASVFPAPLYAGQIYIAGPKYDQVYIDVGASEMVRVTAGGAGTLALSVWDGAAISPVAATADWFSLYVPVFDADAHILRLKPAATDFLAGIPFASALIDYPFARVKLGITGTPIGSYLDTLALPDFPTMRGSILCTTAASWGKNADPYEYYGNLQTGAPIVRGAYARAAVIASADSISLNIGGFNVDLFVWIDGLTDSVDASKITVTGNPSVATAVAVAGFGGQLVKVSFAFLSGTVDLATASMTFAPGAFVRSGVPNANQVLSLNTDRLKRFVAIREVQSGRALEPAFQTGIETPVILTNVVTGVNIVPTVATATKWTTDTEDTTLCAISTNGTIVSRIANPMVPAITNTPIKQEWRNRAANTDTLDRFAVCTPLVVDTVAGFTGTYRTFTIADCPVDKAINLAISQPIYNVTRDQWTTIIFHGMVYDTAPVVPPTDNLASYAGVSPVDWANGDVCLAVNVPGTRLHWPHSKSNPCIRFPTGVKPVCKTSIGGTGNEHLFIGPITQLEPSGFGSVTYRNSTPTLLKTPASFSSFSFVASYYFPEMMYNPGDIPGIVAGFAAMSPILVKLAPFAPLHPLMGSPPIIDPALYTVLVATIPLTVTANEQPGSSAPSAWNGGFYPDGFIVLHPWVASGGTVYISTVPTSGEPGVSPDWSAIGPWVGPNVLYVDVSGTDPAPVHPIHDTGWLAMITAVAGTDFPPGLLDFGVPSGTGNTYGYYDYPLHADTLRTTDGQYQGRLWSGEPALPLLAP